MRVTHSIYYTDFGVFCQQKRLSIFSHTFYQKRSAKALRRTSLVIWFEIVFEALHHSVDADKKYKTR